MANSFVRHVIRERFDPIFLTKPPRARSIGSISVLSPLPIHSSDIYLLTIGGTICTVGANRVRGTNFAVIASPVALFSLGIVFEVFNDSISAVVATHWRRLWIEACAAAGCARTGCVDRRWIKRIANGRECPSPIDRRAG
jgi:hypothetical protein